MSNGIWGVVAGGITTTLFIPVLQISFGAVYRRQMMDCIINHGRKISLKIRDPNEINLC